MANGAKKSLQQLDLGEIYTILQMINMCDEQDPIDCFTTINAIKDDFGEEED